MASLLKTENKGIEVRSRGELFTVWEREQTLYCTELISVLPWQFVAFKFQSSSEKQFFFFFFNFTALDMYRWSTVVSFACHKIITCKISNISERYWLLYHTFDMKCSDCFCFLCIWFWSVYLLKDVLFRTVQSKSLWNQTVCTVHVYVFIFHVTKWSAVLYGILAISPNSAYKC